MRAHRSRFRQLERRDKLERDPRKRVRRGVAAPAPLRHRAGVIIVPATTTHAVQILLLQLT